jgi:hypothetical protein
MLISFTSTEDILMLAPPSSCSLSSHCSLIILQTMLLRSILQTLHVNRLLRQNPPQ